MISRDLKANIKQQQKQNQVASSYKTFLDMYFSF